MSGIGQEAIFKTDRRIAEPLHPRITNKRIVREAQLEIGTNPKLKQPINVLVGCRRIDSPLSLEHSWLNWLGWSRNSRAIGNRGEVILREHAPA